MGRDGEGGEGATTGKVAPQFSHTRVWGVVPARQEWQKLAPVITGLPHQVQVLACIATGLPQCLQNVA